jgi:glycosyltransferase involved in cell wall biosynthesis
MGLVDDIFRLRPGVKFAVQILAALMACHGGLKNFSSRTALGVCMVLLKKTDLFKTVIPSKIFEAMSMERPVILGVEGESKAIIERAGCGVCIEPENSRALADAVSRLSSNPELATRLGANGRRAVLESYDRDVISKMYLDLLQRYAA